MAIGFASLAIALVGASCGSRTELYGDSFATRADAGDDATTRDGAPDVRLPPDHISEPTVQLCRPRTCTTLGYQCGGNGDGCGDELQCGPCPEPQICGVGGYSTCGGGFGLGPDGGPLCTPKTCAEEGYDCGPQGDGCGNLLQCGTCTPPATCGGGGMGVCGVPDGGCIPETCLQEHINCGPAGDGCGNLIPSCGICVSPQTCGGGGVAGQCGGTGNN